MEKITIAYHQARPWKTDGEYVKAIFPLLLFTNQPGFHKNYL